MIKYTVEESVRTVWRNQRVNQRQ